GSSEVLVELEAGEHVLSLRASEDGQSVLPNADITLDKFLLTDVTDGEPVTLPASTLRLVGGASLGWDEPGTRGSANVAGEDQRVEAYVNAMESGYYDLVVRHSTDGPSDLDVSIDGRDAATF